jgi:regulatory protein
MNNDIPSNTITAVTPQKNASDRFSIFVDGEFVMGLGIDVVIEFGLAAGMQVDPELLEQIRAKEEIVATVNAAMHLLAYRARATGELRTRLRQKGFSPSAIDAAVEKLQGWKYLDDEDFAKTWVEQQATHRPRSRRVMAQDLRSKGIDKEMVEETLASVEIDELQGAIRASSRKWETWQSLPPDVRLRRLSGFLARRGYGYDIVRQVAAHFEGAFEDDSSPD